MNIFKSRRNFVKHCLRAGCGSESRSAIASVTPPSSDCYGNIKGNQIWHLCLPLLSPHVVFWTGNSQYCIPHCYRHSNKNSNLSLQRQSNWSKEKNCAQYWGFRLIRINQSFPQWSALVRQCASLHWKDNLQLQIKVRSRTNFKCAALI